MVTDITRTAQVIMCASHLVLAWCLLGTQPVAIAGDALDILSTTELVDKNEEENSRLCQRALYSKSFDNWVKLYLAGKDAEAEKEWAKLIPMVKGCTSLRQLIRGANVRLQFMDGEEHQQVIERGDSFFADTKMLRATEKVLGKDHLLVASIYDYMSNCYVDVRNYPKAVEFQLVAYKIREGKWGKNSTKLAGDVRNMAAKTFGAEQYEACKPYAQRMVDLGTTYGDRGFIREGNGYLTRIKEKLAKKAKEKLNPSIKKPAESPKLQVKTVGDKKKDAQQKMNNLSKYVNELSK